MQYPGKIVRALIASAACALGLSACAINPPKPLPPMVTKTAPMTTLKAVGLSHPKTVWVPAFYTGGNDDLLFINGSRYTAPNGAGNVVGFLPTPTGYTVAVDDEPLPTRIYSRYGYPVAKLQRDARLDLYAVSPAGKTLRKLASIRLHRSSQVFQTNKAFWVQSITGWLHEPALGNQAQGSAPLYSFVGLTAEGRNVSGPANVYYGTPAPGGGWYAGLVTQNSAITGIHYTAVLERNGQDHFEYHGDSSYRDQFWLFHSQSAFVNAPPIVDSQRLGMTLAVNHPYNPIGDSSESYIYVQDPGSVQVQSVAALSASLPTAYQFAQRDALIGSPGDVSLVEQVNSSIGPVYVGTYNVQTKAKTPVFQLVGTGSAVAGVFFGANSSGQLTINPKVDAFTIIGPKGPVILGVRPSGIIGGYNLASNQQISQMEAQQFASSYGLMP